MRWFYIGQASFGLLIGIFVGLSVSPVVSTVIGLLFAFIGGSLLALTKDKTTEQLERIGVSITALSLLMIIGSLSGMAIRVYDWSDGKGLHDEKNINNNIYTLNEDLNVDDFLKMAEGNISDELLCYMIKQGEHSKENNKTITKSVLIDLAKKKYDLSVRALFDKNTICNKNKKTGSDTVAVIQNESDSKSDVKLFADDPASMKAFFPD